jgi:hypothetical protein
VSISIGMPCEGVRMIAGTARPNVAPQHRRVLGWSAMLFDVAAARGCLDNAPRRLNAPAKECRALRRKLRMSFTEPARVVDFDTFEERARCYEYEVIERESPKNLEAERAVLGACLLCAGAIESARMILTANDFFREAHRQLFGAMLRLQARRIVVDLVTLREELEPRQVEDIGPAYISALIDGVPHSSNVDHYARIIKEKAILRSVIFSANGILATAYAAQEPAAVILDDVRQAIRSIAEQAGAEEPVSHSFAELIANLKDTTARLPMLGDVLALGEIAMLHGQPRDGKTWVALEFAIAVALADAAFGLARLAATQARSVLIVSNEDGERATARGIQGLLMGRGVLDTPSNIHLLIGQGCDLDSRLWQHRLIHEIQRLGIGLVILDPLRSLTACVDQGPCELQPFASYLRRLLGQTGVALLLVHHDSKPAAGVIDTRRRAQRASGGAIFSIVDSPLHVERVDARRSLVAPDGFKFCADPESFVFERTITDDGSCIRLIAIETGTAASAGDVAIQTKILAFLKENPGQSGRVIAQGVKAHKQIVADALRRTLDANLVDAVDGPRNAVLWTVRS